MRTLSRWKDKVEDKWISMPVSRDGPVGGPKVPIEIESCGKG